MLEMGVVRPMGEQKIKARSVELMMLVFLVVIEVECLVTYQRNSDMRL